ncbi:TPA: hypothetical protein ACWYFC_003534, partial [Morganella morganii]
INYGISVLLSRTLFQAFEKITWKERISQQIIQLPEELKSEVYNNITSNETHKSSDKKYFPIYKLPQDSCFVIRLTELQKLMNAYVNNKHTPTSTRISSPLSRLFWLSCKHNEVISPLIGKPYKLLSIFEQWASTEGITDKFSGDTLKTALERGSPTSVPY